MNILICDDSITIRKKLSGAIDKISSEHTLLEASNGQEAIEMLHTNSIDMVFMDIIMPVKSGLEATKEMKVLNPEIYIVMLSSVGTKENLKEALENGANNFIQKPWDEKTIEKLIMEVENV